MNHINTGAIPIRIPVPALREMAVNRGLRLSTEIINVNDTAAFACRQSEYGCR